MEQRTYMYMINAAQHSRYNAAHWFRYLRKVIFDDYSYITDRDLDKLLASDQLTMFQKVSLKQALIKGTPTHEHVVSLNKPAKLRMVKALMEKYGHGKHEDCAIKKINR